MNPIVRWQITTPDPDATARFYEALFGWRTSSDNAMAYREVSTGGSVDGGIWPSPAGQQPFVQLFVEVPDIDAHLERAVGLGAKVIVPNTPLPDGDSIAVMTDPVGLPLGICTLRA